MEDYIVQSAAGDEDFVTCDEAEERTRELEAKGLFVTVLVREMRILHQTRRD